MKESGQIPEKGGYRLTGGGGVDSKAKSMGKPEVGTPGGWARQPWTPAPEFEFTLQAVGMSNV